MTLNSTEKTREIGHLLAPDSIEKSRPPRSMSLEDESCLTVTVTSLAYNRYLDHALDSLGRGYLASTGSSSADEGYISVTS